MKPKPAFADPAIKAKYESFGSAVRPKLDALRSLAFDVAAKTEGVGEIAEALKWGQPSFVTKNGKGSTFRIDEVPPSKKEGGKPGYALYFLCQTDLVGRFREMYGDELTFEGNRAIRFRADEDFPEEMVAHCMAMALTYYHGK